MQPGRSVKVYRLLNALGLVTAVGLGIWQAAFREGSAPFSALIFLGAATGLFAVTVSPAAFKTRWSYVALLGAAFLCLALGAPSPLLLGMFAGLGSVLLWKAYETGLSEKRGQPSRGRRT